MANVQIKSVPDAVHDELRRRARQRGKTIREYVLDLIRRDQLYPTADDWLKELESLPPTDLRGADVAEIVREGRAERDREPAHDASSTKDPGRAGSD